MSRTADSTQSLERLRDQAITALVPFFAAGPITDLTTVRLAVEGLLDSYKPVTLRELQLAAQIIALSWAAMACLRTAVAAKNLRVEEMLCLQDDAIELERSSRKVTNLLNARRRDRTRNPNGMKAENTRWDEGAFQSVINQALQKLTGANAKLAAYMATSTPATPIPSTPAPPLAANPKLPILWAEPMTQAVLARRARG